MRHICACPQRTKGRRNEERGSPDPGPDGERDRGRRRLEDRAADERAEEEREDGEDLVVPGDDHAADVEQLRVGHELAPYSREHN